MKIENEKIPTMSRVYYVLFDNENPDNPIDASALLSSTLEKALDLKKLNPNCSYTIVKRIVKDEKSFIMYQYTSITDTLVWQYIGENNNK